MRSKKTVTVKVAVGENVNIRLASVKAIIRNQYIGKPTPTYLPTTKYGYLGEKRQLEGLLWKSPPKNT